MAEATDLKSYSDARSRAGQDRLMRDNAFRALLGNVEGRKLLWWWLSLCRVMQTPFAGEDTHKSAFAQGEQNIGNQLWLEIQRIAPKALLQMIAENTTDKELKDAGPDTTDE